MWSVRRETRRKVSCSKHKLLKPWFGNIKSLIMSWAAKLDRWRRPRTSMKGSDLLLRKSCRERNVKSLKPRRQREKQFGRPLRNNDSVVGLHKTIGSLPNWREKGIRRR